MGRQCAMPLRFLLLTRNRTSRQHSRTAERRPCRPARVPDHSRQTSTRGRMKPRSFPTAARDLTAVGRRFYARGSVLGTSGNFSAVSVGVPCGWRSRRAPSTRARCERKDISQVDERGAAVGRAAAEPSAETLLHVVIVSARGRRRLAHAFGLEHDPVGRAARIATASRSTASRCSRGSMASDPRAREWMPIVDNEQDMTKTRGESSARRRRTSRRARVLLRRHGLYTWGETLADAERHVEILEFLFETIGRSATLSTLTKEGYHGAVQNS